jgi:alkyl hydroperoxide reductase subunit F
MYDLIIIGGGPAGVSAAVYAARKRLKTILLTKEIGGQSVVSETIYNWIGSPTIEGSELAKNFKDHVLANVGDDLELKEGEEVKKIEKNNNGTFSVSTTKETFETKTLLISTGSSRRKLDVKGADELEHKGLTYCASCDGPLFADMDVVVIGGGNAGFESASQLLAYCKSVTLLHRRDELKAEAVTVEKLSKNPKFKIIKDVTTTEVYGDKFVEGLKYKDNKTGEEKNLKVSGIFVEIGQIPNTKYLEGLVNLDKIGKIKIDPWTNQTETPGIWAAGDCTNVRYHQNNIAAGDAVKALEDIYLHLHAK